MRKTYIAPKLDILALMNEDIITTSPFSGNEIEVGGNGTPTELPPV